MHHTSFFYRHGFCECRPNCCHVDWVVLTAAIVGLGLLVFSFVRPAVSNVAEQIGVELEAAKTCMTSDGKTC